LTDIWRTTWHAVIFLIGSKLASSSVSLRQVVCPNSTIGSQARWSWFYLKRGRSTQTMLQKRSWSKPWNIAMLTCILILLVLLCQKSVCSVEMFLTKLLMMVVGFTFVLLANANHNLLRCLYYFGMINCNKNSRIM